MNRTDRLAALVMFLQSRRVVTAAEMGTHFGITERTVYRDLAALTEAGVPIAGEAGVGYRLRHGYHLPPVMFSAAEALALATGGLLAERMTDDSVAGSIRLALGKIAAVLPADLQDSVHRLRRTMLVHSRPVDSGKVPLTRLQMALAGGQVVRIHYHGAKDHGPVWRDVEPLGLVYYPDHWHLIGWCRLRGEERDFRADRILACEVLTEKAKSRAGFDLSDYLAKCCLPVGGETAVIEIPVHRLDSLRRHWGPVIRSQEPAEDGVRVTMGCCDGSWDFLAAWLLGLGRQVRVVKPARLRRKIVELAREAVLHHQPEPPLVPSLLT